MSNQCPYCSGLLKEGYTLWKNYRWQWVETRESIRHRNLKRTYLSYKCDSCDKEIIISDDYFMV